MKILKSTALQIGVAAIGGILFGLAVGDWAGNLKFIGDIFIRLIQMSIVPLVMSSVIVATGAVTGRGTGKLMARTFGWILGFSLVAAVLGWILSVVIQPGAGMRSDLPPDPAAEAAVSDVLGWQETLTEFVSVNIFGSMSTASMVQIVLYSLLFGLALNHYVAKSGNRTVLDFAEQTQQIVLTMIRFVMYAAPVGVFALLANLAGTVGFSVVTTALKYLGATFAGVLIILALMVVVVSLLTRLSPMRLPGKLLEQTVVAVTTTSSAVTFPTVLRNAVEKVGISPRVANFTLSVGMTMGSCGAVLNYTIVVFFLAQAGGVDLSVGQIVLAMTLAILLNIGTITVPGGFPVVALFLASTLDLPIEAVGLMIAVDWFTGIFRTFLNVNGDSMVAMLVANATDEIDRDVYNGQKTVVAEEIDIEAYQEQFDAADQLD